MSRKHSLTVVIVIMLLALAAGGCSWGPSPEPTEPVVEVTNPPIEATNPPETATEIPVESLSPEAPAESPSPESTAVMVDQVQIFLIALEDNGISGELIGCGDSVVAVDWPIEPTDAPIEAALSELLAIHDQFYGESGLYNALYQSDLSVESVSVDGSGVASVYLSGTMMLGGVCDNPRFEAQLEQTVRQFSWVQDVAIFVNGTPLDTLLSGQGR